VSDHELTAKELVALLKEYETLDYRDDEQRDRGEAIRARIKPLGVFLWCNDWGDYGLFASDEAIPVDVQIAVDGYNQADADTSEVWRQKWEREIASEGYVLVLNPDPAERSNGKKYVAKPKP